METKPSAAADRRGEAFPRGSGGNEERSEGGGRRKDFGWKKEEMIEAEGLVPRAVAEVLVNVQKELKPEK